VAGRQKYALLYAPEVHEHVRAIGRPHFRVLSDTIAEQLSFTPDSVTRNRKPLERSPGPFGATWELRCGPRNRFRVFYEVIAERREVWVLAIGVKEGGRLQFRGKEFML
jgi:hypothetical protein